jgi:hypothetical protein
MERFLIDDGIKLSKIVANRYKWSAENADMGSEDANELHADICNQYVKEYEQIAEWLEELKSYKDIGTLKELKELKENGTFTGLELTKLAIMQKELKEYKDLEEHGLLMRLPCKVGDTVWVVTSPINVFDYDKYDGDAEYEVYESFLSSVSYYASGEQFRIYAKVTNSFIAAYFRECDFGKSIFFTREEAEKKLEKMKNEI